MFSHIALRLARNPPLLLGRLASQFDPSSCITHSSRRRTRSVTAQEVKPCATRSKNAVMNDKICNCVFPRNASAEVRSSVPLPISALIAPHHSHEETRYASNAKHPACPSTPFLLLTRG
jgi:hypothetical protein